MSAALDAHYIETLTSALHENGVAVSELNLELAEVALRTVVTHGERNHHVFERYADKAVRSYVGRALREAPDAKARMDARRDADVVRANMRKIFDAVAARYGWYGGRRDAA